MDAYSSPSHSPSLTCPTSEPLKIQDREWDSVFSFSSYPISRTQFPIWVGTWLFCAPAAPQVSPCPAQPCCFVTGNSHLCSPSGLWGLGGEDQSCRLLCPSTEPRYGTEQAERMSE